MDRGEKEGVTIPNVGDADELATINDELATINGAQPSEGGRSANAETINLEGDNVGSISTATNTEKTDR